MTTDNDIESLLGIWSDVYTKRMEAGEEKVDHLSEEDIYRMSQTAGIENADPASVEHLSLCPICMKKWTDWGKALSRMDEAEVEEEPSIAGYGMLKAAAAPGPPEALSLQSACGGFMLGILPEIDNPARGLVTLEATVEKAERMEGRRLIVRDRAGAVILEGRLYEGELVRRHENLPGIDLSTWTIIEADPNEQ